LGSFNILNPAGIGEDITIQPTSLFFTGAIFTLQAGKRLHTFGGSLAAR
jgi:hypothetical protein